MKEKISRNKIRKRAGKKRQAHPRQPLKEIKTALRAMEMRIGTAERKSYA
jgi:hypothetical protein